MKTCKRLLGLCLICTLLSCAGCKGGAPAPSAPGEAAPTAPASSGGAPAAGDDAAAGDVTEMDCFINMPWFFTDKYEGIIPQAITEKTGVRLNVTRAVDDRQLGLMIASGDLPELVFTDKELDRLSNPEMAYPYNELIAKYCPDWQVDALRETNAKAYSSDGNYYFLLNCYSPEAEWAQYPGTPQVSSLAYRTDILEELGSPPLETIDDFVAILGMVKGKYPDLIPLATHIGDHRLTPFRVWMGMGSRNFMELDDGTVVFFLNHPIYKDFCKFINGLYRAGYLNADNFSLSDADCKALLQNGQCFAFSGFSQGEMYRYGQMSKSVAPAASLAECKVLKNSSGAPCGKYYIDTTGWAGLVITKTNQDPGKAIRFIEYLYTGEGQKLAQWGREGQEWSAGEDGFPVFSDGWREASADENLLYGKYNPGFYFGTSAAVEATGRIAVLPKEYRAVYQEVKGQMYFCPWMAYAEPKGDSEEKNILTKLKDLKESGEIPIFLSATDEEFEQNFQKFIDDAKKIGVERLEDYMNENVAKAKALYQE